MHRNPLFIGLSQLLALPPVRSTKSWNRAGFVSLFFFPFLRLSSSLPSFDVSLEDLVHNVLSVMLVLRPPPRALSMTAFVKLSLASPLLLFFSRFLGTGLSGAGLGEDQAPLRAETLFRVALDIPPSFSLSLSFRMCSPRFAPTLRFRHRGRAPCSPFPPNMSTTILD